MKREFPRFPNQRTSILPALWKWNEIGWRRELDVEVELLLESGYLAEDLVTIRDELDVHVDGRSSPAEENGRRAAREVDATVHVDGLAELSHESLNATRVR